MNHNSVRGPRNELGPMPDNDESKRRKKWQKGKRTNRQKHAPVAARVDSYPASEQNGTREYRAEDLSEAVIWVRDYEPTETGVKPLLSPEPAMSDETHPEKNRKSRRKSKPSKKNESHSTVATHIGHQQVAISPTINDSAEQRADHEPEKTRERVYFWNQADVYQPNARDALPKVEGTKSGTGLEKIYSHVESAQNIANSPMLESAVNPNLPVDGIKAEPFPSKVEAVIDQSRQKSGFMGRRSQDGAVQSQQMEGESFERSAQSSPFSEMVSEGVDDFEEPPADRYDSDHTYDTAEFDAARSNGEMHDVQPGAMASEEEYNYVPTEGHERLAAVQERTRESVEFMLEQSEMLEMSKNIQIDGVSVHEMFMAKRVDEAGLRRIIVEYLRGGDLRDVIKNEIIRLQLRFERDPQLRDTPVAGAGTAKKSDSVVKQRAKAILDVDRRRDKTERLAEITQSALEKSHELLGDNRKASRYFGVVTIVVIYLLILIVALTK